jgi:hypothetical protein
MQVESEWVSRCLRDFSEAWDVLTSESRERLLRAVVDGVEYEQASGEVRVTLADLAAGEEALSA